MQETPVNSWVRKIQWRRDRLPTPVFLGFPVAQLVKNLSAMWETWVRSWVGKICWRRERLPTPVFWPGEVHGQRSLACYSLWGCKESDTTGQLLLSLTSKTNCISFIVSLRTSWKLDHRMFPCKGNLELVSMFSNTFWTQKLLGNYRCNPPFRHQ